jgi:hypothetical protein
VAEGLADRTALLLERGPDLPVLVERLGRLQGAHLREPRLAVGGEDAAGAVGQREALAAHLGRHLAVRVVAALILGLPVAQVRDVDEGVGVEVRPVVEHQDQVRPRPRLDRGGDAGLEVVGVDGLERDLDFRLLRVVGDLASHLDVALRNEVHPLQQVDLGGLREDGRATRRENAFEAGGTDHRARREPGPEELPSIVPWVHTRLLVSEDRSVWLDPKMRGGSATGGAGGRTRGAGHPSGRNGRRRHIPRPDPDA